MTWVDEAGNRRPIRADLYRTLRDIRDGHLTLYVTVARFDPTTGTPCPPREVSTTPDRMPAGDRLKSVAAWWRLLAEEGWLRLPTAAEPQIWMLTDGAVSAIDEYEAVAP